MKNNKTFKLVVAIAIFTIPITITSCGSIAKSHAKKEFTEEFKAIPPKFGYPNTTLLVTLRGRNSYDKYLKKAVEKYKGAIVYIGIGEENLVEFADKSKYRFVFDYTSGSTSTVVYSDGLGSSVTAKRFFVKDRIEDKMYQCGFETSYFAKALEAYFENLEIKRISIKQ